MYLSILFSHFFFYIIIYENLNEEFINKSKTETTDTKMYIIIRHNILFYVKSSIIVKIN